MDYHTFIGSLGVTLLLVSFVLLQLKKVSANSLPYALLNFIGAALSAWSSYLIEFLPFVILESTWAIVSLSMLFSALIKQK